MKLEGKDEQLAQVEQGRIIDHLLLPLGLIKAKKKKQNKKFTCGNT